MDVSLEDRQGLASRKGGKCLEVKTFVKGYESIRWECSKGHKFFTTYNSVQFMEVWCRQCAPKKRGIASKAYADRVAQARGGKCLTECVTTLAQKVLLECSEGHQWTASLAALRTNGSWCKKCSTAGMRMFTIEDAIKIAEDHGGRCLSDKVELVTDNLEWACSENHVWKATLHNVKNHGTWCRKCLALGLDVAHATAAERGGRCLSTEYVNLKEDLHWECAEGHTWDACLGNVRGHGTWCPRCRCKTQNLCRQIVEILFLGRNFGEKTPAWAVSSLGGRFQFDMFCSALRLVCEFDGEQHEKFVPFFHNGNRFERQLERDKERDELCDEHWIVVLRIRYADVVKHKAKVMSPRFLSETKRLIACVLWKQVEDIGFPPGTHLASLEELLGALERA